jgi:hypothetical protein
MSGHMMAASPNRDLEPVLPAVLDRLCNVALIRAPHDDSGTAIKSTIPDLANRVVVWISGPYQVSSDPRLQSRMRLCHVSRHQNLLNHENTFITP